MSDDGFDRESVEVSPDELPVRMRFVGQLAAEVTEIETQDVDGTQFPAIVPSEDYDDETTIECPGCGHTERVTIKDGKAAALNRMLGHVRSKHDAPYDWDSADEAGDDR